MKHSTQSQRGRQKLAKMPLWIHKGAGYWAKKIKGRVYYFGRVADDPDGNAAVEQYLKEKDDLEAGRDPYAEKAIASHTLR